ncbi:MAG TPA: aminotransferase class III-fold pyridoxal phosphate-dependent enzyme, partial [Blastocatellia bacterium]|nr:aminotransferase class III-fold pyridoxal phosphate-dependent enzyme [Blastocatellia bacterium]
DTIGYVEAHGTGTALGDPIEVTALSRAFRAQTDRKGFCALGSIKTNLGHLDSAAGVTGLIKAALSLYNKVIPPSLHFRSPNPELGLEDSPFFVNSKLHDWQSASGPRRAGVSSFGIGGTNAHIVLEEAPAPEPSGASRSMQLLVISAKSAPALEEATANLESHLRQTPEGNLADVAYTLQAGRKTFNQRRILVCGDTSGALRILESRDPGRLLSSGSVAGHRPVAFAFPGQGAQYLGMGRDLYDTEVIFRRWIDHCAEGLKPHSGFDLRDCLYPKSSDSEKAVKRLGQTSFAQPALFAIEYSLSQLWIEWGVHPEAFIGHSLGEYTAACLAGVFSLEDALRLVAVRGRLMERIHPGAMLAVGIGQRELSEFTGKSLSIAAINGPSRCVVSGPEPAVAELEARLGAQGLVHRRLSTSHAFHSWMVEPIVEPFRELLRSIKLAPPHVPYVSNVTGTWITGSEATDSVYWVRHLREPVNFNACLEEVLKEPNRVLLEAGPGLTLSTLAEKHPARQGQQAIISSLPSANPESDQSGLLTALGKLWLAGVGIDWRAFHGNEHRRSVPLPTYPFQRQRYWIGAMGPAGPKHEKVQNREKAAMNGAQMVSSNSDRQVTIASRLKEIFGGLTGSKSSEIPDHSTFLEMGGDSLTLLQASQEIKRKLGVKVPFRKMLDEVSTLEKLAGYIGDRMSPEQFAALRGVAPSDVDGCAGDKRPDDAGHIPGGSTAKADQEVPGYADGARYDQKAVSFNGALPTTNEVAGGGPAGDLNSPDRAVADQAVTDRAVTEWAPPPNVQLHAVLTQQLQAMSRLVSEQLELLKLAGLTPAASARQGNNRTEITNHPHQRSGLQEEVSNNTTKQPPTKVLLQNSSQDTKQPANLALLPDVPQPVNHTGSNGNGSSPAKSNGQNHSKSRSQVTNPNQDDLEGRQRKHIKDLIGRFSSRTAGSKRIAERYRPVLADDRATSGFHPLWKEMQYPLIARRASGSRVWDIDDNEYVDITMGFGALLFGHTPPFVIDALRAQAQEGTQLGWESPMSRKAAELIHELTGVERVAFCNSGTEAVMTALRLARTFTGRDKIAMFEGAYHGTFDEVLVRATKGEPGNCEAMPLAPGIPRHITDGVILLNPNSPQCMDLLRARAHELAAVLVEPMQRARPDVDSEAFLKELRQITEESGAALIFDEVITGFRLHTGGAQALFGVRADLVTYGKSIGGGVPVAVVAGKAAFMDAIDGGMWNYGDESLPEADATFFAGTFFKHPLLMASVAAVLEHIKVSGPRLQEDLNQMTADLAERLNHSFGVAGLPIRAAHRGSFFRFLFPPELKMTDLFYFHLLEKGVYVCETRNCFLSTAHTSKDVDYVVRAALAAGEEMMKAGFFPSAPNSPSAHNGNGHLTSANSGHQPPRLNGLIPAKRADLGLPSPQVEGNPCPPLNGAGRSKNGSNNVRIVPLTEAQRQVWALAQMGSDASAACNESFRVDLRGPLSLSALRTAVAGLVSRHPALRTVISKDGADQHIHPAMGIDIRAARLQEREEGANHTPANETPNNQALNEWLSDQAKGPFNFELGPLFRVGLASVGEQHHVLALTFSHIIVDARSTGILLGELAELYNSQCQGRPCRLPDVDHTLAQAPVCSEEQSRIDEEYWVDQFADCNPILELPADRPRSTRHSFAVSRESGRIAGSLARELRSLSAERGSTMFMTLLSGFSLLLHALSGSRDLAVGMNLTSELAEEREDFVGYSINPLPIRFKIKERAAFAEYLAETKRHVLDAFEHRNYSAARLIKRLNLRKRFAGRLSFSSAVFNLDKPFSGLTFFALDSVVTSNPAGSKADIEWNVIDEGEEFTVDCNYNSELFDAATIRRWISDYET